MTQALSVVVPTRDRPAMLRRCLESLARTVGPDDELVVVDSVSQDGDEVRRTAEAAHARYVRADAAGASRARNAGWLAARHDLIAFVDDDVIVDRGWADGTRAAFAEHPDAAFLTGRIEVPPEQGSVDRPVAVKDDGDAHPIDDTFDGIIGHSANFAVRRDAIAAVTGFDTGMGPGTRFVGAEDLDLFDRLLAGGAVGWYAPHMHAFHDQWRTPRDLLKLDWGIGGGLGARLAKLLRTDRRRARAAAGVLLWRWGVWDAYRWARAGKWLLALSAVVRVAGGISGLVRGMATRLHGGLYASPS